MEIVKQYRYLSSIVENRGGSEMEIRDRIILIKGVMCRFKHLLWGQLAVLKKVEVKLVNSLVFSVFLYGAKTLTLRECD